MNKLEEKLEKQNKIISILKNCRMMEVGKVDYNSVFIPLSNKYDNKEEEKGYLIFLTAEEIKLIKEMRKNE